MDDRPDEAIVYRTCDGQVLLQSLGFGPDNFVEVIPEVDDPVLGDSVLWRGVTRDTLVEYLGTWDDLPSGTPYCGEMNEVVLAKLSAKLVRLGVAIRLAPQVPFPVSDRTGHRLRAMLEQVEEMLSELGDN